MEVIPVGCWVEVSRMDLKSVYPNRRQGSRSRRRLRTSASISFPSKYSYRSLISVSGLRDPRPLRTSKYQGEKREKNLKREVWITDRIQSFWSIILLPKAWRQEKSRGGKKDNTAKRNLNVDNPVFSPPRSKLPFEFRISSFLWLQLSFPFFPPQFLFPLPSFNPPSLFSSVLSFSRVIGNLDLLTWDFPTQFLPDLRDHGSSSTSAHPVRWVQLPPKS